MCAVLQVGIFGDVSARDPDTLLALRNAANRSRLPPCPIPRDAISSLGAASGAGNVCQQAAYFAAVLRVARRLAPSGNAQDPRAQEGARIALASGRERLTDAEQADAWHKAWVDQEIQRMGPRGAPSS